MDEDKVVALPRPGSSVSTDPLLTVLREGAVRMLTQVIEAEVEAFLANHAELRDEAGRRRVDRNGHAPERTVQTGIGPLPVRRPKVRDKGAGEGAPIRFHVEGPAALSPSDQERRRTAALAVSEGDLDRPARRRADGAFGA